MIAFQQVCHLMHDDVFQAFRRMFRQFQIEPDATGADIAAPPTRLHLLDAPFMHLLPDDRLIFLDQFGDAFFEFSTIKIVDSALAIGFAGVGFDRQLDDLFGFEMHLAAPIFVNYFQAVIFPEELECIIMDQPRLRDLLLGLDLRSLLFYPRQSIGEDGLYAAVADM